jgi:hypothetical protein
LRTQTTTNAIEDVREKGTLRHCWWECKLLPPLLKTVWRLPKKLKIELQNDPVIPLLGIYLKECKSGYNKDTCTHMFIVALFIVTSYGNNLDALQLMKGLRKCGLYLQWNFLQS